MASVFVSSLWILIFTCFLPASYFTPSQDTEYPGIVAKPLGVFKSYNEKEYQTLKCNVDLLRIIQLGKFLPPNICYGTNV